LRQRDSSMFFIYICIVAVVVAILAFVLRPTKDTSGGSLDQFLGSSDQGDVGAEKERKAQQVAAAEAKYREVYSEEGKQVLILFATEYGFSEEVSRKLFDGLYAPPQCQPRLVNARDRDVFDLEKEQAVLIVCSTTGDGVPPTDAREWLQDLVAKTRPAYDLSMLHYSVLALGDSNYPHYCKTGRTVDAALGALGAVRLVDRAEVDQEDWAIINKWFSDVKAKLSQIPFEIRADYITSRSESGMQQKHGRLRPYMAEMIMKHDLTEISVGDEERKVIHAEFMLDQESELCYTAGDSLGIYPLNNPPEVDALLKAMGQHSGEMLVPVPKMAYEPKPENEITLRERCSPRLSG